MKMRKFIIVFMVLFVYSSTSKAQATRDVLLGGGFDVYKTDHRDIASKFQIGVELNYFIIRNFSVTGGIEIWNGNENNNSLVVGMRWYPLRNVFTSVSGLIGQDDLGLGAGYGYPLNKHWRIEGIVDYYFKQDDFAFRIGVAYLFRK